MENLVASLIATITNLIATCNQLKDALVPAKLSYEAQEKVYCPLVDRYNVLHRALKDLAIEDECGYNNSSNSPQHEEPELLDWDPDAYLSALAEYERFGREEFTPACEKMDRLAEAYHTLDDKLATARADLREARFELRRNSP